VTGAGGGIGAGIALGLAERGATVVVNDLDEAAAAAIAERLGRGSRAHACDVSDPPAATELVERTARDLGRVDVLVNNAGILGRSTVEEMPDEEWRRVLAVNLDACFFTSRAALRAMRPVGYGRIVNVASIAGIRVSLLGSAAYTASKAGLIGLTHHLAVEAAPHGITVNAILPGLTATPLVGDADVDALAIAIPTGRAATPEDHAAAVAFLASREAGQITGVALPIDGGMSLLPGPARG
jgi:3-oxoacyl-[acyl-carrier protein] reductase